MYVSANKCVPHVVASCSTHGSVKQTLREKLKRCTKTKKKTTYRQKHISWQAATTIIENFNIATKPQTDNRQQKKCNKNL